MYDNYLLDEDIAVGEAVSVSSFDAFSSSDAHFSRRRSTRCK